MGGLTFVLIAYWEDLLLFEAFCGLDAFVDGGEFCCIHILNNLGSLNQGSCSRNVLSRRVISFYAGHGHGVEDSKDMCSTDHDL